MPELRTHNISGIYWTGTDPLTDNAIMNRENDGEIHLAATIPGMCVEYLVICKFGAVGSVPTYELYERATSFGLRRGEVYTGPPTLKCETTFPGTRAGFAEALAYLATVVSDQWFNEGHENHA